MNVENDLHLKVSFSTTQELIQEKKTLKLIKVVKEFHLRSDILLLLYWSSNDENREFSF